MAWQGIYGVDDVALQFARANRRGRLGGSFLFVGPGGAGKRTFAFALAKAALCRKRFVETNTNAFGDANDDLLEGSRERELENFLPCEECESCRLFRWSVDSPAEVVPSHPDFHFVRKPDDRATIPLELLVGEKDARARSGLRYELSGSSYMGGRKVAVIDDADFFNIEGANALLKTLEEPPPNSIIILIGESATKQLPTIRSRCQVFRFKKLNNEDLTDILLKRGLVDDPDEARRVARNADGSLVEARKILDGSFVGFQQTLYAELSRARLLGVQLATKTNEFVESAGKEASIRRQRLRNVLKESIAFYRAVYLLSSETNDASVGASLGPLATSARKLASSQTLSPDNALACVEKTLDALEMVERNVNAPFVVDAWAYALAAEYR